jgi:TetR/AcrR family transcriptional repressor of lmrAB and yxaGH operons
MKDAQKTLLGIGYEVGCPLATIALESTAQDKPIRQAVAKGFEAIRSTLKKALVANGLDSKRAASLAAMVVSAYEGGLIQARVAGSKKPLQDTAHMLLEVLQSSLLAIRREP